MDDSKPLVEFTDECPVCKGRMAVNNKFCSHSCWLKAQVDIELSKNDE